MNLLFIWHVINVRKDYKIALRWWLEIKGRRSEGKSSITFWPESALKVLCGAWSGVGIELHHDLTTWYIAAKLEIDGDGKTQRVTF
ncbi:hypothetical protein Vadar_025017 [Vaccinium darrowii]|uniref:Uncharacterized protein n=1 Tax=Vaccinium darrowii TaxID=229202 RepID=A0ACB7YA49_9ERIC|nr:hypothetical protein Vadar_025017 [Vaccinium darrowii]